MSCKPSLSKSFSPSVHRATNVPAALTGGAVVLSSSRCVLFDGSNDYAISSAIPQPVLTDSYTIAFWTIPPAGNGSIIGSAGGGGWAIAKAATTSIDVQLGGASVGVNRAIFASAFSGTTVRHIAITFDGATNTVRCYRNGAILGSPTVLSAPIAWTAGLVLGVLRTSSPTSYYNGKVWDVRLYSVAKSALEIAAIFAEEPATTPADTANSIAMWMLQEGSGTSHTDSSGNGKTMTATNVTESLYHTFKLSLMVIGAAIIGSSFQVG